MLEISTVALEEYRGSLPVGSFKAVQNHVTFGDRPGTRDIISKILNSCKTAGYAVRRLRAQCIALKHCVIQVPFASES